MTPYAPDDPELSAGTRIEDLALSSRQEGKKSGRENTLKPRQVKKDHGTMKSVRDIAGIWRREVKKKATERNETICFEPINPASTSSGGGRKGHSHFSEGSEDDHTHAQLGRDHHSGVGEGEVAHHTDGLRRGDVEVGSLPSGDEEGSGGHSHPVHSRDPGGWELGTARDSGPGDYSHEEEGSGGRIHPWGLGKGDEVGSETGRGHAQGVPRSFGSRIW
jgi:hypothetical protein